MTRRATEIRETGPPGIERARETASETVCRCLRRKASSRDFVRALGVLFVSLAIASPESAADPPPLSDELVTASSVNSILQDSEIAVVYEERGGIGAFARAFRDRFLSSAELIEAAEALRREGAGELGGRSLIVFGTPDGNAWIRAHSDSLPFRFEAGGLLRFADREFRGRDLRCIAAVRRPGEPARKARPSSQRARPARHRAQDRQSEMARDAGTDGARRRR